MMKTKKQGRCPECGAPTVYEVRNEVLEYQCHTKTVKTRAHWCTRCGEGVLSGEDLQASFKAHEEFRAEVDGVLKPREVAAIREKLGLSQRKAGELLGGGPRSFYKYERGKQRVSVPMSHLLRLLAKDPGRLEELRRCSVDVSPAHPSTGSG
jgi:HTH-type transcriptional regulator/antitoxin MqsA